MSSSQSSCSPLDCRPSEALVGVARFFPPSRPKTPAQLSSPRPNAQARLRTVSIDSSKKEHQLGSKANCSARSRSSPLGKDDLRKCEREVIYIRKTRTSKKRGSEHLHTRGG
ncbi:hypothetical protein YC2023_090775 [Brassica napus]